MIKIINLLLVVLFVYNISYANNCKQQRMLSQHCIQELPTDTTIRKGVLPNGMTYYIKYNAQAKGLADFFFAQRVGSILEQPCQRGLAHFLEHMAFNGSTHFPDTPHHPSIVKWCESVGIKFGTNLNAYTGVDQTVYNISSVPTQRQGIIDSCLLIMHDWSHGLLLQGKEIDKERGVVQEEWRTRRAGMAMERLAEAATPIIYQGSKYANSMPIGSMDVVMHFPYQALRDYYDKWYRPDLQAVIVVGDVDVQRMEQQIKTLFSDIPMPEHAAKRIYYPVPDNDKMLFHIATDKEQPTVNFTLYMKRDVTPWNERCTLQTYADDYKTSLVKIMLNDRLDEKTLNAVHTPFISASVGDGNFFLAKTKDALELSAVLKESQIKQGIQALVAEAERARTKGFTLNELKRAKAVLLNYAEVDVADKNDRRNAELVEQCVNNFLDNEPIITPDNELALVKQLSEKVTLNDVNLMARQMITNRNEVVTLYGPKKFGLTLPSSQTIEQIIMQAQQAQYEAYHEKPIANQLIDTLPTPGSIVSEKPYKYGYTHILLSNGMHVYVRPTHFEKNEIIMNLYGKGGKDLYPDSELPNLSYLISGATAGGIGAFDATSLEKYLSASSVEVTPFITDHTEGMKGNASVKDFKTMFQLMYLYFTSPRKDKVAFNNLMSQQAEYLTNLCVNPMIAYNDTLHATAYGSKRLESITKTKLSQVNYNRILQIYKELFGNAANFNLILTGNIDMQQLRPLLCQYMASLPSSLSQNEETGTYGVQLLNGKHTKLFYKQQETPSNTSTIVLKADIPFTDKNDLLLDAIAQLLRIDYIETVREQLGGVYGVDVSSNLESVPRNEAVIRIAFRTAPEKYHQVLTVIYQQLNQLANKGPKPSNLAKVKAYELKVYNQVLRMNNYWEYVLYNDLYSGVDLDTRFTQIVNNMSGKDIQRLLKTILKQGNCIEVTMTSSRISNS